VNLVLLALATWRLSSLVTREDGPGYVFARLRQRAGAYRPGELSSLAEGIICMWCVSVWAAAGLYALLRLAPALAGWLLWPLAVSALVIFVEAFRPSEATDF
jgi:hypothetical protein